MKSGFLSALLVITALSNLHGGDVVIKFDSSDDFNAVFDPFIQKKISKIRYNHFTASGKIGQHSIVKKDEELGSMEKYPDTLSEKPENNLTIHKSMELYDKKEYIGAAGILEPLYDQERDNPHYLNVLGRTLFWINDKKAHERSLFIYERLISILDRNGSDSETLAIDVWFLEAYWKLGCLYLDYGRFDRAVYEISRSMLIAFSDTGGNDFNMLDQKYSYLTEAYYFLKNKKLNEYFYNMALKKNPKNEYVLKFRLE